MEKENTIKPNVLTQESELKKNTIRIIKGSSLAIVVSIVLLSIFAILLTYTELSEATITPVVLVITGISILVGSTISSKKIRKNGLLNGAGVGAVYIFILYLASSLCIVGFSLSTYSFIMFGVSILTGMIGGIIGVNLNKK